MNINTRAWYLSVEDDTGTYSTIDINDHKVSDVINEYIKDMEREDEI